VVFYVIIFQDICVPIIEINDVGFSDK